MLSVPWGMIDAALDAAGPLDGKPLIDTTNQFGPGGVVAIPGGLSAAEFNAGRAPGGRLVKSYNTMTAAFQAEATNRTGGERVAEFHAGADEDAKRVVAGLIHDSGFEPVDIGDWGEVWIMEAPRRDGSVYGEEYRPKDAREIAAALTRGDRDAASRLARERKVG